MILAILLSLVFLALGLIHLNWAIGGQFGFAQALPTNEKGERVLIPRKIESAIVGIGLIAFGLFYTFKADVLVFNLNESIIQYVGWIIPGIFLARATGEFKYVGFFKKITTTEFARWDTKLYSPLCLIIGIVGVVIELILV